MARGDVDGGRWADERDPRGRVPGAQGAQEGRRLQGLGHPAVHDHRDIHAQTV